MTVSRAARSAETATTAADTAVRARVSVSVPMTRTVSSARAAKKARRVKRAERASVNPKKRMKAARTGPDRIRVKGARSSLTEHLQARVRSSVKSVSVS